MAIDFHPLSGGMSERVGSPSSPVILPGAGGDLSQCVAGPDCVFVPPRCLPGLRRADSVLL